MSKPKVLKTGPDSSPKRGKRSGADGAVPPPESTAVLTNGSSTEIADKVMELVRLAQEQGQLTFNDISEALPDNESTPEKLDEIYSKLRALEIEIVDQAEVGQRQEARKRGGGHIAAGHPGRPRADVSQPDGAGRIADAANRRWRFPNALKRRDGNHQDHLRPRFCGQGAHCPGGKTAGGCAPRERFDRVILDKKVDSRDEHLRALRRAAARVQKMDETVDAKYTAWRQAPRQNRGPAGADGFQKRRPAAAGHVRKILLQAKGSSRKWRSSPRISTTSSNTACAR